MTIEDHDRQLIANASICQAFKSSEMYALLDSMMEALENDALERMSSAMNGSKDDLFALTLRWQERKAMRRAIKEEIESNISDAQSFLTEMGLDPDEWRLRSEIENV